ncbi:MULTISPECIES: mycothiol conjugate amidase Mca [unclassified Streptomyces]|uniref:mycothiol conjugate amidase Mca n=1 Tax=unclassified Streptomyces TaxID=2593676 RepID=UPI000C703837|nr:MULTISPECIES: mycothiol conjugate amidase Mca [unclassified Streptomyces]AUH40948.1 mycothiol conjugate amidase Mca [Streptomyces sp. CMB-StM0423]WSA40119.1 mycothiol conjugate amidase Mca [Streptomyces sp. NBC_01808]
MSDDLRLMAVHAHPDDESSKGAATMAKYVSEGVEVLVATCTGGERGSILNPKLQGDAFIEKNMHEVRRKEMAEAREILGVKQAWLGFVDSGLPEGDPLPPLPEGCFALQEVDEAAEALVRLIREFKPQVITTYDENGGYPHPDHIMTHKITMAAFDAAGDPARYPDAGEPWQPLKVYYNQGFNRPRTVALHEAMLSRGLESPYGEWLERWKEFERKERTITTYVPCADFFAIRDKALIAHATQIDPDGPFFKIPMEVQQEVWPTEEYELAKSLVDTSLPEDDLFAGIRDN